MMTWSQRVDKAILNKGFSVEDKLLALNYGTSPVAELNPKFAPLKWPPFDLQLQRLSMIFEYAVDKDDVARAKAYLAAIQKRAHILKTAMCGFELPF